MFASSSTLAERVLVLDLDTLAQQVVKVANNAHIDGGYLSVPKAIEFPTEHGLTAHAVYYPPRNRDFTAPPGEKPPLVQFLSRLEVLRAYATGDNKYLLLQLWISTGEEFEHA